MRPALFAMAGAVCLVPCASAQSLSGNVYLAGPPAPAGRTCVQVEVAGQAASSLNCLNQALARQLQSHGLAPPPAPLGAGSPSNAVGTFNEQSVREQYGRNFGKSVVPYRPPPPAYNNPLH